MNQVEWDSLKRRKVAAVLVGPVWGWDRTLLFGYSLDRDTLHVYQAGGLVHRVVTTCHDEVLEHAAKPLWLTGELVREQKRWYPGRCDLLFVQALERAGQSLMFTTFEPDRAPEERFKGVVCGCGRGKGVHWMA